MDQDVSNDPTPPENPTESNPEEPTAAHFREAARLAAARVRAALASKSDDPVSESQPSPPEPGDFEEAARQKASSLSGHAPEAIEEPISEPAPEPVAESTPSPKSSSKSGRAEAIAEIDERLELGARMMRAFESQIQRLERSAHAAEAAQEALDAIPDPSAMEEAVAGFEQRVLQSIEQAEGALNNLQQAAERSNSTAEALAGGLETANTVKSLLETSLHTLSEEADARSADVKRTLAQTEAALDVMNQQLKRAEEIEHAVGARLSRAQGAAEELEHTSQVMLGSIREHVARELSAIGTALIKQTPQTELTPTTFDPPLIEVESMQNQGLEQAEKSFEHAVAKLTETSTEASTEAEPPGQQISRGTLSIDESAIKRQADDG